MLIKNTGTDYGSISKGFHWLIALLLFFQFYLVYWKQFVLPPKSSIATFYIVNLHKPIGLVILLLAIFAIAWKVINMKPAYPPTMARWEMKAARAVQLLLYVSILVMPISGVLMSVAAGKPPNFFGYYEIPQFIEKNEFISKFFFNIHATTSYIVIGLVILHTAAALKHHFINKDRVLKRMLPFN